jgi:hypothetical protein
VFPGFADGCYVRRYDRVVRNLPHAIWESIWEDRQFFAVGGIGFDNLPCVFLRLCVGEDCLLQNRRRCCRWLYKGMNRFRSCRTNDWVTFDHPSRYFIGIRINRFRGLSSACSSSTGPRADAGPCVRIFSALFGPAVSRNVMGTRYGELKMPSSARYESSSRPRLNIPVTIRRVAPRPFGCRRAEACSIKLQALLYQKCSRSLNKTPQRGSTLSESRSPELV